MSRQEIYDTRSAILGTQRKDVMPAGLAMPSSLRREAGSNHLAHSLLLLSNAMSVSPPDGLPGASGMKFGDTS